MISAKNLSSLKVVQRRNEHLGVFYSKTFGGNDGTIINIEAICTYEIDLSKIPSDAVGINIYYNGNNSARRAIDFDAIVTYG